MLEDKLVDKNIEKMEVLTTPEQLWKEIPVSSEMESKVISYRNQIGDILKYKDDRFMVVIGPCSMHDKELAIEYAQKLKELSSEVEDKMLLVMRTYFEKPRTRIKTKEDWTGMVYDPNMDGTGDIEKGIRQSREILSEVTKIGLPTATEFVNLDIPHFYSDLISYAVIGARTYESQPHRHLASGLSMPVGIKNGTCGNILKAVDAVVTANNKHTFLGINEEGKSSKITTKGNEYAHVILRGGDKDPNYSKEYVAEALKLQEEAGINTGILIDASHANSAHDGIKKDPFRQPLVSYEVIEQRKENKKIIGLMVESHLTKDSSKTDKCLPWTETKDMIKKVYDML